ncbi:hypothetical protein PISMIDRAFT_25127 [Pisolithus microcarpus 441]|uniref:inorganic diphosphatase n=1 Tax=Pisolithus microcarpus 441 TaxID=765257 RepID=A0A0C9YR63_9AGAM|nr:hypothetical protein PISMIDRAFT_25127 [Pisolithus microcarpus 441]
MYILADRPPHAKPYEMYSAMEVIIVDIHDPLTPKLNNIEDVEHHLPGLIRAMNEWFRIYKIPDGKGENTFAFSGEAKNKNGETDAKTPSYDISMYISISSAIPPPEYCYSHNLTISGIGTVSPNDPTYTSIPPDTSFLQFQSTLLVHIQKK